MGRTFFKAEDSATKEFTAFKQQLDAAANESKELAVNGSASCGRVDSAISFINENPLFCLYYFLVGVEPKDLFEICYQVILSDCTLNTDLAGQEQTSETILQAIDTTDAVGVALIRNNAQVADYFGIELDTLWVRAQFEAALHSSNLIIIDGASRYQFPLCVGSCDNVLYDLDFLALNSETVDCYYTELSITFSDISKVIMINENTFKLNGRVIEFLNATKKVG